MTRWWIILLVMVLTGPAHATQPCARTLRVALQEGASGVVAGQGDSMDVAVLRELASRLNCPVQFETMPRQQIWLELAEGRSDLTPSALKTAERINQAFFIPYLRLKTLVVLNSRAMALDIHSFAGQPEWRLGVVRAFAYGPSLDPVLAALRREPGRLVEATTVSQLLPLLQSGRIDGFLAGPTAFAAVQALTDQTSVHVRDWLPHDSGLDSNIALSLKSFDQDTSAQWAATLATLRQDGTLKAIYRRYLPEEAAETLLPAP